MAEAAGMNRTASTEPIDPDLWDRVRVAVVACGDAADQLLQDRGWHRRVAVPSVGQFDSGWPNLHRSRYFPDDNAPIDFSAMFGQTSDQLTPVAYSDVPALATLISYVRSREDLVDRLTIPTLSGRDEIEDTWLDTQIAGLPVSLLSRARATGVSTDESLRSLYLELERAWLVDPLPVEYVVPLALTALELDDALVVTDCVRIEPMDAGTQAARAPQDYSLSAVPDPVVSAATHALVVSGCEIENPGPGRRLMSRDEDNVPLGEVELLCEALRLVTHVGVGFAQVLRRPLGWADRWVHDLPALTTVMTVRRYSDSLDNYGWLRAPNEIPYESLRRLPVLVESLRRAAPNVRLAARRLSQAALRDADDDTTVDACIGIEALLGEGQGELSHRMALRAATALATRAEEPSDPKVIYDLIRKVYSHRSAVVHGARVEGSRSLIRGGRTYAASTVAVILLRELLVDVLSRPGGWTPRSLDDVLLESITSSAEP